MHEPFSPRQETLELVFQETRFGAGAAGTSATSHPAVAVAVRTPVGQRTRRLDVTSRTRVPGAQINWIAACENLRARLLGAIAAETWRTSTPHDCVVLTGYRCEPEFIEHVRRELVEQLDLDPLKYDDRFRAKSLSHLARDFCDWLDGHREDGGVAFERVGDQVVARTPHPQLIR